LTARRADKHSPPFRSHSPGIAGSHTMKRAVLYLRVSTVDQTTANQERELREIAAEWVARLSKSTKITASAAPRAGIGGRR
jgi:hypothetical protein